MAILLDIERQRTTELGPRTVIGRGPECCISVKDKLVSLTHAEIRRMQDGRYEIVDLGSTHGTYVSGEKILVRILADGDEIIVGGSRLRFEERLGDDTAGEFGFEADKQDVPDSLDSLPRLESVWQKGSDFLKNFEPGEGPGKFFHPAPDDRELPPEATPGVMLSVHIRFQDRDAPSFHVHARVLERRASGEKKGLLLEFLAEEAERQELVLACAEGESIPFFKRRFERFPCSIPVQVYVGKGRKLESTSVDICERGIGLVPNHRLKTEMSVRLHILFPNRKKPLTVRGRVASVMLEWPQQSVGIEFLFESIEQKKEMAGQVAMLRSTQPK